MNRTQVDGKTDQAKGAVKRKLGELTGDEELRNEGAYDEAKGDIKEAVGDLTEAAKRAAGRAAHEIKKDR